MKAIFKKDFKSFFSGMSGYITIAFITACIGLYFSGLCIASGYGDFSYALGSVTFIFLVVVPLLTMRSLVEERKQKTDQLLLTAPVTPAQIVFGKYGALLCVYAMPLLGCMALPLILSNYGEVPILKSYIAIGLFFLMGAAAIAVGLFISSLTDSVPLSAVGTFGVLLACYLASGIESLFSSTASSSLISFLVLIIAVSILCTFMTKSNAFGGVVCVIGAGILFAIYFITPSLLEGAFGKLLSSLALFTPYNDLVTGVFNLSSVVYYISVSLLFVFLSIQSIEKRRAG